MSPFLCLCPLSSVQFSLVYSSLSLLLSFFSFTFSSFLISLFLSFVSSLLSLLFFSLSPSLHFQFMYCLPYFLCFHFLLFSFVFFQYLSTAFISLFSSSPSLLFSKYLWFSIKKRLEQNIFSINIAIYFHHFLVF